MNTLKRLALAIALAMFLAGTAFAQDPNAPKARKRGRTQAAAAAIHRQ